MVAKKWVRKLAAGAVWAVVYNGLWGLAWLAFMRREWTRAAAASSRSMPWSPDFWAVWIPMTLPFGLAVGAYLLSRPKHVTMSRDAVAASMVVWVPGTVGMAFGAALTPGSIVVDSFVNLAAVLASSLLLAEAVRRLPVPDPPEPAA
jgi:hypothetical protein